MTSSYAAIVRTVQAPPTFADIARKKPQPVEQVTAAFQSLSLESPPPGLPETPTTIRIKIERAPTIDVLRELWVKFEASFTPSLYASFLTSLTMFKKTAGDLNFVAYIFKKIESFKKQADLETLVQLCKSMVHIAALDKQFEERAKYWFILMHQDIPLQNLSGNQFAWMLDGLQYFDVLQKEHLAVIRQELIEKKKIDHCGPRPLSFITHAVARLPTPTGGLLAILQSRLLDYPDLSHCNFSVLNHLMYELSHHPERCDYLVSTLVNFHGMKIKECQSLELKAFAHTLLQQDTPPMNLAETIGQELLSDGAKKLHEAHGTTLATCAFLFSEFEPLRTKFLPHIRAEFERSVNKLSHCKPVHLAMLIVAFRNDPYFRHNLEQIYLGERADWAKYLDAAQLHHEKIHELTAIQLVALATRVSNKPALDAGDCEILKQVFVDLFAQQETWESNTCDALIEDFSPTHMRHYQITCHLTAPLSTPVCRRLAHIYHSTIATNNDAKKLLGQPLLKKIRGINSNYHTGTPPCEEMVSFRYAFTRDTSSTFQL